MGLWRFRMAPFVLDPDVTGDVLSHVVLSHTDTQPLPEATMTCYQWDNKRRIYIDDFWKNENDFEDNLEFKLESM